MASILDYLDWRGDITFAERPFNEVDNLLLAELSYLDFGGIVPADFAAAVPLSDAVAAFTKRTPHADMGVLVPDKIPGLAQKMAASARFRDVLLSGYVCKLDEQTETQFAALCAALPDGTVYAAFRGTDDTIVGWKEDFAMAFRRPVAAQESAARYLADIAGLRDGPLMVGGHSKGGNLAVYAAANAPAAVQERLIAVFCHDGPGFDADFFDTPGYARVAPLVDKSVPESSIVGMLFEMREHVEDGYTIVSSDGASIMQHFALNWQVERGEFVHAGGLSASSRYLARTINGWMAKFDDEHRRRFIENLFAVLEAGGYDTFGELTSHWTQSLPVMLAAVRGIDAEDRDVMADVLKGFAATAATSVIATKQ